MTTNFVGNCGRIFKDFEICIEPPLDDLCQGCPYNDEEEECYLHEEEAAYEWEEDERPDSSKQSKSDKP